MNSKSTKSSLKGLRVLNTRPIEQGEALSTAINQAGGIALNCPALAIVPTQIKWLKALPDLDTVKQAIFTSVNAVNYAFKVFAQQKVVWPSNIEVTAVGRSTANQLKQHKITVKNIPPIADSEHLLALPSLQEIHKDIILLFKGEGGRLLIPHTLKARGAKLIELIVYRREKPFVDRALLKTWWHNKTVDIILFTSQEAMQNIFSMFERPAHSWLKNLPCLVISKRLADAASSLGMQNIIISSPDTILETLSQFNKGFTHE
ncbi:uroporphyrinogen-III synthase [Legionella sp. CNM-1927-20]|uniref:uroporphyrinogen-III synthase n=1 Tax=Legionella sp. CNM-1927-20 TaxID=3422221 RepID=UPI00403B2B4B